MRHTDNTLKTKRLLGIDLGSKRIGLAISDELDICIPHTGSIDVKGSLEHSAKLIIDWYTIYTKNPASIETILVGNPLHLSGQESKRSEISKSFCQKLELELKARDLDTATSVILWDERLTSVESETLINNQKQKSVKGSKRRELKDQISATLILESYQISKRSKS